MNTSCTTSSQSAPGPEQSAGPAGDRLGVRAVNGVERRRGDRGHDRHCHDRRLCRRWAGQVREADLGAASGHDTGFTSRSHGNLTGGVRPRPKATPTLAIAAPARDGRLVQRRPLRSVPYMESRRGK